MDVNKKRCFSVIEQFTFFFFLSFLHLVCDLMISDNFLLPINLKFNILSIFLKGRECDFRTLDKDTAINLIKCSRSICGLNLSLI